MIPNRTNITIPPDEPDIVVLKLCHVDVNGSHYDIKLNLTKDDTDSSKEDTIPTNTTLFTHDNTMSVGYSSILLELPRKDNNTACQEVSTRLFNGCGLNFRALRIEYEFIP